MAEAWQIQYSQRVNGKHRAWIDAPCDPFPTFESALAASGLRFISDDGADSVYILEGGRDRIVRVEA